MWHQWKAADLHINYFMYVAHPFSKAFIMRHIINHPCTYKSKPMHTHWAAWGPADQTVLSGPYGEMSSCTCPHMHIHIRTGGLLGVCRNTFNYEYWNIVLSFWWSIMISWSWVCKVTLAERCINIAFCKWHYVMNSWIDLSSIPASADESQT